MEEITRKVHSIRNCDACKYDEVHNQVSCNTYLQIMGAIHFAKKEVLDDKEFDDVRFTNKFKRIKTKHLGGKD